MDKEWFSVLDVEKQTGIPNQTIRRYLNIHGVYLNPRKRGKSYYLSEESIKVIQEIRKMYDEGLTAQLVNDTLQEQAIPMTIVISDGEEKISVHVSEALQDMKKSIDQQNEVIRSLQEYIENKLEERDKRLIEAIRESQEARKEIAASQEQPKEEKKGFFARLFGK